MRLSNAHRTFRLPRFCLALSYLATCLWTSMWLLPSPTHHVLMALTPQSSTGSAGGTIQASLGYGKTEHQSRSECKDTYGRVYNGDKVDAAQEVWNNANATYIWEHNANSETFQLRGTQFIDLSQESIGPRPNSASRHQTPGIQRH